MSCDLAQDVSHCPVFAYVFGQLVPRSCLLVVDMSGALPHQTEMKSDKLYVATGAAPRKQARYPSGVHDYQR